MIKTFTHPRDRNPFAVKKGDALYFVPSVSCFGKEGYVTVIRVGRDYGYFKHHGRDTRFRLTTLSVISDTGTGTGCKGYLFRSKDVWDKDKAREKSWEDFRLRVSKCNDPPAGFQDDTLFRQLFNKWF